MNARKWAGMWLEIVLKVFRVHVWVHFRSMLGSVLGSVFERFDEITGNLLLTWNGKRAFILLRFFPSLLVFSHLFSLLPASSGRAGGPAGRLFTFLPVSSLFFASLLASPRLCGRAGGTTFDVSSRLFSFFRLCTIWSRWIYISFCKCIIFIRNTELPLLLLG